MNLYVTTLRTADGTRQFFSNTRFSGANIINLSRSDNRYESLKARMHKP